MGVFGRCFQAGCDDSCLFPASEPLASTRSSSSSSSHLTCGSCHQHFSLFCEVLSAKMFILFPLFSAVSFSKAGTLLLEADHVGVLWFPVLKLTASSSPHPRMELSSREGGGGGGERGLVHIWKGYTYSVTPERTLLSRPVLQVALGTGHGLLLLEGSLSPVVCVCVCLCLLGFSFLILWVFFSFNLSLHLFCSLI